LNSLNKKQLEAFIIIIRKPSSRSLNTNFPVFYVDSHVDQIPLVLFLREANKILQRNKAETELSSMLIHDIRSPLNSLIGYLELLLNDTFGVLNEGQKNILEKAMDMGDLALDMLEDLNEVYYQKQQSNLIQKQNLNFPELVEAILINNWVKTDRKNIKIRKNISKKVLNLYGDDYQIQRALNNIVINAIKYSPANSCIEISARLYQNNFVLITVSDSGGGVPESQLLNLFDKYFKVKQEKHRTRRYGLGLYICKIIVESHGGKIWAENNSKGGLSVHLTLPMAIKN